MLPVLNGKYRQLIDELDPGDYVMVHAGMAIAKITDNDADETDDILEDLN